MEALIDAFRSVDGARLRVVATLESLDYEVEFVREDLKDSYSEPDFKRAYHSVLANQVSADDLGQIGGFGALDGQLFLFEEAVILLFPSSRYEGVFASFDRTRPFPLLDVVDAAGDVSHVSTDGVA